MNDDYLWDGSGEPDPEVQRLERVLGKYRYQPGPVSVALTSHVSWRRSSRVRIAAAAAAAVLMVLGALMIYKLQNKSASSTTELEARENPSVTQPAPEEQEKPRNGVARVPIPTPREVAPVVVKHRGIPKRYPNLTKEEPSVPLDDLSFVAERRPIVIPFIDVETARHLERAQLLLRSFRNSREPQARFDADLSYERQQSKGLLSRNVLLRRDAEMRGNMPVDDLLGTLEPFLLDIANLPDRPSRDDLRSIKQRMQKQDIVAALQIYSAPTLSQSF